MKSCEDFCVRNTPKVLCPKFSLEFVLVLDFFVYPNVFPKIHKFNFIHQRIKSVLYLVNGLGRPEVEHFLRTLKQPFSGVKRLVKSITLISWLGAPIIRECVNVSNIALAAFLFCIFGTFGAIIPKTNKQGYNTNFVALGRFCINFLYLCKGCSFGTVTHFFKKTTCFQTDT